MNWIRLGIGHHYYRRTLQENNLLNKVCFSNYWQQPKIIWYSSLRHLLSSTSRLFACADIWIDFGRQQDILQRHPYTTSPSKLYTTSPSTQGVYIRQLALQRFIPLQQTPRLIPNDSRTSALASIHELITGQRNFGGAWGRHFSRGSQAEPWKLRFCGHLVASMWEPIGWMLQTFMASGNRGPIKRRMVSSTLSADWSFTSSTATLYLFWYIIETIYRGKANTGYQVLNNVKRFRSWRHLRKF